MFLFCANIQLQTKTLAGFFMSTLYWSHSSNNPSDANAWGGNIPSNDDTIIFPWGTANLDNTKWDAGTITLTGGSSVSIPLVPENAAINITNGSTLVAGEANTNIDAKSIVVTGGSNVTFSSPVNTGDLNVNNGSTITFNKGLTTDSIELVGGSNINISGPLFVGGHQITQTGDITYLFPNAVNTGSIIVYNGNNDTCFLEDCDVLTPYGYKNITEIKSGSYIIADGEAVKVLEIGVGTTKAINNVPLDLSGYPVCITKNAFGENKPNKDIHLTPEHSVYMNGFLIPIRLLVNDVSIYYDTEIEYFEYYHIICEKHTIVDVNGLDAETYYNTGNSFKFKNNIPQVESDIFSQILVSGPEFDEVVTLVSEQTMKNFDDVELYTPESIVAFNHIPSIVVANRSYYPIRKINNRYVFSIPNKFSSFAIVSDKIRPCDIIGNHCDDRRYLGVHVKNIIVNNESIAIDTSNNGWYSDGWTNGHGIVNHDGNSSINTIIIE